MSTNEESQFRHKCMLIYEVYLDTQHPGFREHYADGITDAIATWWKPGRHWRVNAEAVVKNWLIPTLKRTK